MWAGNAPCCPSDPSEATRDPRSSGSSCLAKQHEAAHLRWASSTPRGRAGSRCWRCPGCCSPLGTGCSWSAPCSAGTGSPALRRVAACRVSPTGNAAARTWRRGNAGMQAAGGRGAKPTGQGEQLPLMACLVVSLPFSLSRMKKPSMLHRDKQVSASKGSKMSVPMPVHDAMVRCRGNAVAAAHLPNSAHQGWHCVCPLGSTSRPAVQFRHNALRAGWCASIESS